MNKVYIILQRDRFNSEYGEVISVRKSKEEAEKKTKSLTENYKKNYNRHANHIYFDIEEWEVDE